MTKSIDPGAPKVGFWSKNLYFWAPFWHRFFIEFSCFFRTPFQRPFLEGLSANLSSTVRFWSHFGFKGVPRMTPLATIFGQKGAKRLRPRAGRPGRNLAPKTLQRCIILDLEPFLVDFGRIFDEI